MVIIRFGKYIQGGRRPTFDIEFTVVLTLDADLMTKFPWINICEIYKANGNDQSVTDIHRIVLFSYETVMRGDEDQLLRWESDLDFCSAWESFRRYKAGCCRSLK